jgi:hypothetical protein
MNTSISQQFYLFKGDWYERFIELLDQPGKFVIWESLNKSKGHHLIIMQDAELSPSYCLEHRIWKTDEAVFDLFYKDKQRFYILHSNSAPAKNGEETGFAMFDQKMTG